MTLWDLIRALVRRWPIVLAGALITGALTVRAMDRPGVFWQRTRVVFFYPATEQYPNSLRTRSEDVVIMAGIVGKRVAGPDRVIKYASPEVDLVGVGVRDGWWVRIPDTGGQWATNFVNQELIVEVVGPDPERVGRRNDELVAQIFEETASLQRDAGVKKESLVTVSIAGPSNVIYIGPAKTRSMGMTALLGAGATITGVLAAERTARRRRRRGAAAVQVAADDEHSAAVLVGATTTADDDR